MNDTQPSTAKRAPHRLLALFYTLLTWLPWLWLLLLALFAISVTAVHGQMPSYGQPDPKTAGWPSLFYFPTLSLLLVVLVSPPVWLLLNMLGRQSWRRRSWVEHLLADWRQLLVYLTGLAFFFLVILGDVLGLMTWLAD